MTELAGKVAVVTGGARDIGRAISMKLASLGASVVVNYFDNADDAGETIKKITAAGGKAVAIQGDMTKEEDVRKLVESACSAFGAKIHILVNNAGGLVARKKMEEMDLDFWNFVIAVNLTTAFLTTKYVLPVMADGGAIVNFASQAARDGGGGGAIAYSSAKGAVATFTRGLAKELGARKIRVNALAPGMINTTFHNTFTKPEIRAKVAGSTPLGREGEAPEIAELVAFLASDRSSFVNGDVIDINGGTYFS
jgi:3-oxoacyl-[acyl-carrier protein] reductase